VLNEEFGDGFAIAARQSGLPDPTSGAPSEPAPDDEVNR
jgi:hydrogenase expression/formation protein HypC